MRTYNEELIDTLLYNLAAFLDRKATDDEKYSNNLKFDSNESISIRNIAKGYRDSADIVRQVAEGISKEGINETLSRIDF